MLIEYRQKIMRYFSALRHIVNVGLKTVLWLWGLCDDYVIAHFLGHRWSTTLGNRNVQLLSAGVCTTTETVA